MSEFCKAAAFSLWILRCNAPSWIRIRSRRFRASCDQGSCHGRILVRVETMKTKTILVLADSYCSAAGTLHADRRRNADITGIITGGEKPEARRSRFSRLRRRAEVHGHVQRHAMGRTGGSGVLKMVAKSFYPLNVPQRAGGFRVRPTPRRSAPKRRTMADGLVGSSGAAPTISRSATRRRRTGGWCCSAICTI